MVPWHNAPTTNAPARNANVEAYINPDPNPNPNPNPNPYPALNQKPNHTHESNSVFGEVAYQCRSNNCRRSICRVTDLILVGNHGPGGEFPIVGSSPIGIGVLVGNSWAWLYFYPVGNCPRWGAVLEPNQSIVAKNYYISWSYRVLMQMISWFRNN